MNLMEQVVLEVLEKQWTTLHEQHTPCNCDVCKNDILALTLNALPTRYVAHAKGKVIQRAMLMDEQIQADVLRELSRAVRIVAAKPSHL